LAVASKRRAEPKPLIVSIRGFGSTKALSLWDAVPGRCSRAGPPRDEGRDQGQDLAPVLTCTCGESPP